MKALKIVIALFLALTLLVSVSVFSIAGNVEEKASDRLSYITGYDSTITHGTLSSKMNVSVEGSSSVTKIKIKMELQKENGGSYSTVETWEETFYSSTATKEESKLTSPFSTYRLKTTITAYAGSNSETIYTYAY